MTNVQVRAGSCKFGVKYTLCVYTRPAGCFCLPPGACAQGLRLNFRRSGRSVISKLSRLPVQYYNIISFQPFFFLELFPELIFIVERDRP